ncbi:hypothetical protein LOX59_06860, partial [Latilactobacillus curvatus]
SSKCFNPNKNSGYNKMTIYYLKPEKTVDEIINTLHASVASMQYFETLDMICEKVEFNLDEAALLQRIKQLADD